jgi:hypothetical protein
MNDPGFNPLEFQGTRWYTIRPVSGRIHYDHWVEVDRNKLGRVTVCPEYCWNTIYPMVTLDKKLVELFSE